MFVGVNQVHRVFRIQSSLALRCYQNIVNKCTEIYSLATHAHIATPP